MSENRPNKEQECREEQCHENKSTQNETKRLKTPESIEAVNEISRKERNTQLESSVKANKDEYRAKEHYEIRNCRQESSKYENGMFTLVEIEGKAKGNFLIDSGSAVTLLSSTLFEKLDENHLPALQQPMIPLIAVNEQELRQHGTCVMNISIGKSHYQHAIIICDLPVDGILGQDFLMKHVSQINFKQLKLQFESEVISCWVGEQGCEVQEAENDDGQKDSRSEVRDSKTEDRSVACVTTVQNQNKQELQEDNNVKQQKMQTSGKDQEITENSTTGSDAEVGSPPTSDTKENSENRKVAVPEDYSKPTCEDNQFQQPADRKSGTQVMIVPECRQDIAVKHQHHISAARHHADVRRPEVEKKTERIKQKLSHHSAVMTGEVRQHCAGEVRQHCEQHDTCKVRKRMKRNTVKRKQHNNRYTERCKTRQAVRVFSLTRKVRVCGKPKTRWKRPNLMTRRTGDLTLSVMPRRH